MDSRRQLSRVDREACDWLVRVLDADGRHDPIPNPEYRRAALHEWLSRSSEHMRTFLVVVEIHEHLKQLSLQTEPSAEMIYEARADNVVHLSSRMSKEKLERVRARRERNTRRRNAVALRKSERGGKASHISKAGVRGTALFTALLAGLLHADQTLTYGNVPGSMPQSPTPLSGKSGTYSEQDDDWSPVTSDNLEIWDRGVRFSIQRKGAGTTLAVSRGQLEITIDGEHRTAIAKVEDAAAEDEPGAGSLNPGSVQIPAGHVGRIITDRSGSTMVVVETAPRGEMDSRAQVGQTELKRGAQGLGVMVEEGGDRRTRVF